MEKVLYEDRKPREFAEHIGKAPTAYMPFDTLEWHGLHLPLGSDDMQSCGLFCKMARRNDRIVLLMLFVAMDIIKEVDGETYIGMNFWHCSEGEAPRQLPGSAHHVTDAFYIQLLDSIVAQLKRAGFKKLIGHGHLRRTIMHTSWTNIGTYLYSQT